MELDGKFVREFEVECINKTLNLFQSEVGDESCVVWDAAIVLSKYLESLELRNKGWLKNKKVVELGAGLGCVGLVAACLGADTVLTDLPKEIGQLQYNIDVNENVWKQCGGHARAVTLEWGNKENCIEYPDVLLVADCVYYEESIEQLISTMQKMCGSHTKIFLSQEERESEKQKKVWKEFLNAFNKHFDVRPILQNEQHPVYNSTDICVLVAERKTKLK